MASTFDVARRPDLITNITEVLRTPGELRDTDRITIAHYNVYNLFGRYADKPKPLAQREALAQVILALRPDVITFAEVEAEGVLKGFFSGLVNSQLPEEQDKYDAFVCIPANDRRGINVAIVTRLSVQGAMTFHDRDIAREGDTSIKFSRDLLGVEIQMTPNPAHKYLHFASHLKSQIGGAPSADKRGLEAAEIVKILSEPTFGQNPFMSQPCILAGDFNDVPTSKAIGLVSAGGLIDAFGEVEPNDTYPTNINSGKSRKRYPPQRLDYMFATPSMAPRLSDLAIYREEPTDEASDHYPMTAVMSVA
jgi:endonuclease/exonuclease/phosphatase family metal-dependent hydrolase